MTQELPHSLRTIGVDDGYFPPEFKRLRLKTLVVGVLCVNTSPVKLKIELIDVDGNNGTEVTSNIVKELAGEEALNAIFLDGVTIAGFNYVDPEELYNRVRAPVIVIFKTKLKLDKVKKALMKHFSDWIVRYEIIERNYLKATHVKTPKKTLTVTAYGVEADELIKILHKLQVTSPTPEPLRLADVIASGLTKSKEVLARLNKLETF